MPWVRYKIIVCYCFVHAFNGRGNTRDTVVTSLSLLRRHLLGNELRMHCGVPERGEYCKQQEHHPETGQASLPRLLASMRKLVNCTLWALLPINPVAKPLAADSSLVPVSSGACLSRMRNGFLRVMRLPSSWWYPTVSWSVSRSCGQYSAARSWCNEISSQAEMNVRSAGYCKHKH